VSVQKKQRDKKKTILFLGVSLIIVSILLTVFSIVVALAVNNERMSYFEQENIFFEKISVVMEDGIEIQGIIYADKHNALKEDHSIPTVLLLHGINGRKEQDFNKAYQLVKMGYAVVSVEQRGHGESGGFVSFLGKEPEDMVQVIDYIEENYKYSNSSHIAIIGFSYGGGVATVLQAIDDRVHASVLYHPMASIKNITSKVPFQNLIGITPSIIDINQIEDGFDKCNPSNTKNLLLIHGNNDDLILPSESEALYKQVGGPSRDDIDIEIRPNLGHGENEGDPISFKHTLVWLEHFFHNSSIDIQNRTKEIQYIELLENQYPSTSNSRDFLLYAAILMFFGLSLLIVPLKLSSFSKETPSFLKEKRSMTNNKSQNAYNKMVFTRIVAYIIPAVVGGLLCSLLNPSLIYGYFIFIPLATIIILLFIPREEYPNWNAEWKNWKQNSLKTFLYSAPIILLPVISFVIIFNINSILMISGLIPFFTQTTITYISIIMFSVIMDYLLLRGWIFKHTIILIGLRPLTLFVFWLFVPIPEFTYLGGIIVHILFLSLIGIVFWMLVIITEVFSIAFKNKITVLLIIGLPIIIFLVNRFFRIM